MLRFGAIGWLILIASACSSYAGDPSESTVTEDAGSSTPTGETLEDAGGVPQGGSAHRLVVDLNLRSAASQPRALARLRNGELLLQADDGVHGSEPWVSGGTEASTRRLGDLVAGPADCGSLSPTVVEDGAFLSAVLPDGGDVSRRMVIWFTDGTEAGTRTIFERALGPWDYPRGFPSDDGYTTVLAQGSRLCFVLDTPQNATLTCLSRDGAVVGEFPGASTAFVHDGAFHFTRNVVRDGGNSMDLFVTDGTSAPQLIASGYTVERAISFGARAVLLVRSAATGREIATLEGGLLSVHDQIPGADDGAYALMRAGDVAVANLFLAPVAGGPKRGRAFVTDGTDEGTAMLADPLPNEDRANGYESFTRAGDGFVFTRYGSDGLGMFWASGQVGPDQTIPTEKIVALGSPPTDYRYAALDNVVLFGQYQAASGSELWVSEGTGSTRLLRDMYEGNSGLVSGPRLAGSAVVFGCQTPETAAELCLTNGVEPPRVHQLNTTNTAAWNGSSMLRGDHFFGFERVDGKNNIVHVDVATGAVSRFDATGLAGAGGGMDGVRALGEASVITMMYTPGVSTRRLLRVAWDQGVVATPGPSLENGALVTSTEHGVVVRGGVPNETYFYWDGQATELRPLALADGTLPEGNLSSSILNAGAPSFLVYRVESALIPYRVDDAVLVPLVRFGLPAGAVVRQVYMSGEALFLITSSGMYRSSGNTDDLALLAEPAALQLPAGSSASYDAYTEAGGQLFRTISVLDEVGATDFERSGVYAVRDGGYQLVVPGYVMWTRALNGTLLVKAMPEENGRTVVSNGRGERLVVGLELDYEDYTPVFEAGRMYLMQNDGVHGVEMWVSDGTPGGTRLLADIAPGARSSNPSLLGVRGDRTYLLADDYTHGYELQVVEPVK